MAVKNVSTRVVSSRQKQSERDMEFTFEVRPFITLLHIPSDVFLQRPTTTFVEPDRMQKWAKGEARTKNNGTGRSAVGVAVTGHKAKVKAGGGSLRTLASGSASTAAVVPRKPGKAATLLSVVSDKSSRFG